MNLPLLKRKVLNKGALWISLWKLRPLLAPLNQDSIVIDCGANIGDISAQFAKTGATVYAFEPDPAAFAKLKARFENHPKVHLVNKAVWTENKRLSLFLHQDRDAEQVEMTVSSSLVKEKKNVDQENAVEIEAIDLIEFIEQLDKKVSLIKMDIEGAEVDILKEMIARKTYEKFELAVVETHETKIPGHTEEIASIKALFEAHNIDHIKLNWI